MPPKRACDTCISRKVKCSGSWPCDTCRDAPKKVSCTYLRPVRRRGPKVKRTARKDRDLLWSPISSGPQNDQSENHPASPVYDGQQNLASDIPLPPYISKNILAPIIHLYRQFSYSVWPIINADALLEQLDDIHIENAVYTPGNMECLVTAMCAATMAQLDISPVKDDLKTVDSTILVQACLQIRSQYYNQRAHPDVGSILVSFFLHVYHAKVNHCTTAMMYIHEAISGAKSLDLDKSAGQAEELQLDTEHDIIANRELVFPLLWVSERGYAMHLGLSPSYIDPPPLAGLEESTDNHVQGLLNLVRLFMAFDQISLRQKPKNENICVTYLTETETRLSSLYLNLADPISTRTADCHITRQWMRTIVWQKALSMQLLSSSTSTDVMTFNFPAKVGRDLLHALRLFSETDLLPLGRDQLLKCFEVANSLADTALLTSAGSHPGFQLSTKDFLHALYQKLSPFLERDPILNSILRAKTAEVLIMAPARLLKMEMSGTSSQASIMSTVHDESFENNTLENKAHSDSDFEGCHSHMRLPTGLVFNSHCAI